MLKLIGWVLKASLFAVAVLVAAHYVTWDGKPVSDQIGSTLSSAEKSAPVKTIHRKSRALIRDAREAVSRVGVDAGKREPTAPSAKRDEAIPAEDRARLQALIHSSDET